MGHRPWEETGLTAVKAFVEAAIAIGRACVRLVATHTGLPAIVVAAILLYAGYRLFRRTFRFLVHVALIAFGLAVATKFGWLTW